jgi:hypothetical protein
MPLAFALEAEHHRASGQNSDYCEQATDKACGAKRQPEAAVRWLGWKVYGVRHDQKGPALTLAANG